MSKHQEDKPSSGASRGGDDNWNIKDVPANEYMMESNLEIADRGEHRFGNMDTVADVNEKRSRKLTEKGYDLKMSTLDDKRKKMNSRLIRQAVAIEDLMYSSSNIITVKEELSQFDYIFKQLVAVQEEYRILKEEREKFADDIWFEEVDERVFAFKHKVINWMKEVEAQQDKSSKHSSKQSKRTKSSQSSKVSKAVEEKAKLAELMAEVKYLERRQLVENQAEKLRMEEKLAKAKARSQVYEAEDDIRSSIDGRYICGKPDGLPMQINNKPITSTRYGHEEGAMHQDKGILKKDYIWRQEHPEPLIKEDVFVSGRNNTQLAGEKTYDITQMMCDLLRHQSAPEVTLEAFKGDPLEYHYFMSSFKEAVEYKVDDPHGRLVRLLKFTEGEAKEIIKHCIQQPPATGYEMAKTLLERHYGNPHRILSAYRKEMKIWPPLKPGDSAEYQKFYNFLIKCDSVMSKQQWNILDTPDILCTLISKLPGNARDRWNRKVFNVRRRDRREPALTDLIEFVEEENILANDPFSKDALKDYTVHHERSATKRRMRAYASQAVESMKPNTGNYQERECPVCGQHHDLDDCATFMDQSVEDRSKLLGKKRLCYGCYLPISMNHNARTCKNRKICKICKSKHPTGLHGFTPKKKIENLTSGENDDKTKVKCNSTSMIANNISMCVVPVTVMHPETNKHISTYAMLDNCSQGTFIKESLKNELGLSGRKTSIIIKTLNGEENVVSTVVTGLKISSADQRGKGEWLSLPITYSKKELPADIEEIATRQKIIHWDHLKGIVNKLPEDSDVNIGLLIGANCTKALEPQEVIPSSNGGPFAFKTTLGWCIVGPLTKMETTSTIKCNRIIVKDATTGNISQHHFGIPKEIKDVSTKEMLAKIYDAEFTESVIHPTGFGTELQEISIEDKKFLKMMNEGLKKVGKHYQLPLPLKVPELKLPNNKSMAMKRLWCLKKKFGKNHQFFLHYKTFIEDLISKGYAQKARGYGQEGKKWYIPHHGVYHPQKPGKIRVVFDCSAEFQGVSLNKNLMSGPDLSNQIAGVLVRFREEPVAIMGDIEAMFHQVLIPEKDRDIFRFLWWDNNDIDGPVIDYQMCVHVFGATSSPSCCNYALKRTAIDNKESYHSEVTQSILRNFYVDDLLKSVKDSDTAIRLVHDMISICAQGGFKLTKFVSNKLDVLHSIPDKDRIDGVKDIDLDNGADLPNGKALGINWNVNEDSLGFKVNFDEETTTRRGMLSMISRIYDPLGLASPFLLEGKRILQVLCKNDYSWDQPVSEEFIKLWDQWKAELKKLRGLKMNRCFKPQEFGKVKDCSLHHFSDASQDGYGQVSYIRLVDESGNIHCNLVMAKSRVAPLKYISIPRMELTAAALSVKVSSFLKKELTIHSPIEEYYWTDSQVVLAYINNDIKRFKIFVANRIQLIREKSLLNQWMYIESKNNPADYASRGLTLSNSQKVHQWLNGPDFLWKEKSHWPSNCKMKPLELKQDDPEVKSRLIINNIIIEEDNVVSRLQDRVSNWQKMIRIMVFVMRFIENTAIKKPTEVKEISIEELQKAEIAILKNYQKLEFKNTIQALGKKDEDKKLTNDKIGSLNPYLDEHGLIRVGGRLRRSNYNERTIHPILLPRRGRTTTAIISWCHQKTGHSGRNITLNEIRASGYWVLQGNSAVKSEIARCVICRRLRGKAGEQFMADLPKDRLQEQPPFTYCGVDLFGPFYTRERRTTFKRYGALFTCLSCRAIHIEMTKTMDTDSFILALRRFIARRGNIRMIRCDNGSNFIGAERELTDAIQEMDHEKIKGFMLTQGADWINWRKNPPMASHMGGVWERQIRSARSILSSLLRTHGQSLDDESLNTLFTEVEAIVNSRPLTVETINDVNSEVAISPSNILTMKSKVVLPPPGVFGKPDLYCRRRWRRVQHISNEFWSRWRKEFLSSLQERQKWKESKRNFQIGDVVILKEDSHRNEWKLSKVIDVYPDDEGYVRSVQLYIGTSDPNKLCSRVLMRPVDKVVLLVES